MEERRRWRAIRARLAGKSVKTPAAIFFATAALVVTAMTTTGLVADAQEVISTGAADSDGNVPVRSVCFGAAQYDAGDQYVGEQQDVGEQQYASEQYVVPEVTEYTTEQYEVAGVQYATGGQYASEQLALYSWSNDGYATYGEISIDDCALDAMGAGPDDRERVLAHERGHAAGLSHSDNPDDLMYPVVPITGS